MGIVDFAGFVGEVPHCGQCQTYMYGTSWQCDCQRKTNHDDCPWCQGEEE